MERTMKKALYSSLVVVMLANGNIQNAYGSMKVDRSESPVPSAGTVVTSIQAVTGPTEKELSQLYVMPIAYVTNFYSIGVVCSLERFKQSFKDVTKEELIQLYTTVRKLRTACDENLFSPKEYPSLGEYSFMERLKQSLEDVYAKLSPDQRAIFIKLHEKAAEASSETWDAVENISFGEFRSVSIEGSEADAALLSLFLFHRRLCPTSWELLTPLQQPVLDTFTQAIRLRESLGNSSAVTVSLRLTEDDIDSVEEQQMDSILGPNSIVKELILEDGITKDQYRIIANSLKGNRNLKQLVLAGESGDFATVLEQLPNLKALSFGYGNIGVIDLADLAPILKRLPNLTEIDFSDNNIGVDEAGALAMVLKQLPNLTKLTLYECGITEDGAKTLADVLPQLTNLTELNLGHNDIGTEGIKTLAPALKQLHLKRLNLTRTGLDNTGAKVIADVLADLKNLVELDLSENDIGCDGTKALHKAYEENTSLTTMNLHRTTEKAADVVYDITYDKRAHPKRNCTLVEVIPNTMGE